MATRLKASRKRESKDGERVLYLYGVTSAPADVDDAVRGVDAIAPLEALECSGLTCWISRVPRSEFADDLAKNLENLDWLAERSTRHHRAVSAIAERADILPARFGVVFRTEASLRANLEAHAERLRADLERIKGTEEWGIKVFSLSSRSRQSIPLKAPTGREYLRAKAALLPKRAGKRSDPALARFAASLERIAEDTAEGGRIGGGRRDLQFQVSLLVKRSKRKRLEAAIRRFANAWRREKRIECTGPWPPFSFASRSTLK